MVFDLQRFTRSIFQDCDSESVVNTIGQSGGTVELQSKIVSDVICLQWRMLIYNNHPGRRIELTLRLISVWEARIWARGSWRFWTHLLRCKINLWISSLSFWESVHHVNEITSQITDRNSASARASLDSREPSWHVHKDHTITSAHHTLIMNASIPCWILVLHPKMTKYSICENPWSNRAKPTRSDSIFSELIAAWAYRYAKHKFQVIFCGVGVLTTRLYMPILLLFFFSRRNPGRSIVT